MAKRKHYENIFKNILIEAARAKGAEIMNIKLTTFAALQMCTGLSLWFKKGGELSIDDAIDQYYRLIISFITVGQTQNAHPSPGRDS
jgi:hypothetical protein